MTHFPMAVVMVHDSRVVGGFLFPGDAIFCPVMRYDCKHNGRCFEMRKRYAVAVLLVFMTAPAFGWPGVVLLKNGALYWGQYKNVSGVMAIDARTPDLTTAIRDYPLAGVTSVVVHVQRPGRPFFTSDGALPDEASCRRLAQDLDTINTLEMLPIVVLFDPDPSCQLKNAKAYAAAASAFQQTFGKSRYFLVCITDRCDDPAWKKGVEMVREVAVALRSVAPAQVLAAGASKAAVNENLLKGDAAVHLIMARGVSVRVAQAPVIEIIEPSALTVEVLETVVTKTIKDRTYGFVIDFADGPASSEVLGRMFAVVDALQKAAYPGSAPDPADTASLMPGEKEEGFLSLFNGRDLTGWLQITAPNDFIVENGAIKLVGKAGGWLRSWHSYGDYMLRLEFKIVDKGNNGIYNRCGPLGRQSRMGFELQIFGDPAEMTPTKESCGAIYDVRPPDGHFFKPGEWNAYEVICKGDAVKISLNGHVIHDVRYDDIEAMRPRSRKGFIGLQDHHNTVEYRNIRIRPMDGAPSEELR